MLISVALPVPFASHFDYLNVADVQDLPAIGCRVSVPFGSRTLIGIVIAHVDDKSSNLDSNRLKPMNAVLDQQPIIDQQLLSLALWLSSYYHYPLGNVFAVILPVFIRKGKALTSEISYWKLAEHANIDTLSKTAYKQREQFALVAEHTSQGITEEQLLLNGAQKPYLKTLADKGLIEQFYQIPPLPTTATLQQKPLCLNDEQQQAVERLKQAHQSSIQDQQYQGFLLYGVTGSGKTEVYLQIMQQVLQADKQVLILVPEIGLTPQTKARFEQRFNAHILLLHSGLNDTARMKGWQACKHGHAQIIIGTRSTLLYPFAQLGLIIVDEAHDTSYKQQDHLRYHAPSVALYRGFQQGIPVILGTATPSLEHLYLVKQGKLTQLTLKRRAGNAQQPILQLVKSSGDDADSKTVATHQSDGKWQDSRLNQTIITAIKERLEAHEQVLIFLNRRGYAPVLLCDGCDWQADCPHCDAHLTVHKTTQVNKSHNPYAKRYAHYLQCHHCGWRENIPHQCPACNSNNLHTVGMGTSQLTDHLHAIFGNPQTSTQQFPIVQIDRDTTRNKDSWQKLYHQIEQGEPCILVGTQMLAKGHHFAKVGLVVVADADIGFLSADFRSPEHTAQLITQVSGRAGRESIQGRVMIQTRQADNPLLPNLIQQGYYAFAQKLLAERKMLDLPPYSHGCLFRCDGRNPEQVLQVLQDMLVILSKRCQDMHYHVKLSSVIEAPMTKKQGRYRYQVLLLAQQRPQLHQLLHDCWQTILAMPTAKYVRLSLDIDPIQY